MGKTGLSITKFAKLSRITRELLIHYDKKGLLTPDSRGKNRYRCYSSNQLAIANLIRICRELGISLNEIGELIKHRTPDIVQDLFERQIVWIDKKIGELAKARKLLTALKETISSVKGVDADAITVEHLPAQTVIYGELNDCSQENDAYDALLDFYLYFSKKYPEIDLNYPVWGIFSEARILRGDVVFPDRYYFHNPDGLDRLPAGLYAIGYCRGGYGETGGLYKKMMKYIDANGYAVCGPAYEEYPLNEICVSDPSDYLIRLKITVRKR
jgi:DNA-binding transcriptional MerR regulator